MLDTTVVENRGNATPGNTSKKNWNLGRMLFWILLIVTVLGVFFNSRLAAADAAIAHCLVSLCLNAPYIVGCAAIILLRLLYALFSRSWSPVELIRGKDNRWSTSKCQFFLWTIVAIFSYASFFAALVGHHLVSNIAGGFDMPTNLVLAMGFSVATVVAAKGIVTGQINTGSIKDVIDDSKASAGDLVKDDGGDIDLTKVQMLGWTIIAIGAYLAILRHTIGTLGPTSKLPDIDTALMVLMGLGQGAYLAKKAISSNTPTITKIDPTQAREGDSVTLTGTSFGPAQGQGVVVMDGVISTTPIMIAAWSDTAITFKVPTGISGSKVIAIVSDTKLRSNNVTLNITPIITKVDPSQARAGTSVTLTGTSFGSVQGVVMIDGVTTSATGWLRQLLHSQCPQEFLEQSQSPLDSC